MDTKTQSIPWEFDLLKRCLLSEFEDLEEFSVYHNDMCLDEIAEIKKKLEEVFREMDFQLEHGISQNEADYIVGADHADGE
jgi:hypothetical protein